MNKVKIIKTGYPGDVEHRVVQWMKENPKANVIAINGAIREEGDTLTYILYTEGSGIEIENLLKS